MLLVDRRGVMTDQHCEYARKLLNEDDDEDDDDDSGDNSDDGDDDDGDDDGKSWNKRSNDWQDGEYSRKQLI